MALIYADKTAGVFSWKDGGYPDLCNAEVWRTDVTLNRLLISLSDIFTSIAIFDYIVGDADYQDPYNFVPDGSISTCIEYVRNILRIIDRDVLNRTILKTGLFTGNLSTNITFNKSLLQMYKDVFPELTSMFNSSGGDLSLQALFSTQVRTPLDTSIKFNNLKFWCVLVYKFFTRSDVSFFVSLGDVFSISDTQYSAATSSFLTYREISLNPSSTVDVDRRFNGDYQVIPTVSFSPRAYHAEGVPYIFYREPVKFTVGIRDTCTVLHSYLLIEDYTTKAHSVESYDGVVFTASALNKYIPYLPWEGSYIDHRGDITCAVILEILPKDRTWITPVEIEEK